MAEDLGLVCIILLFCMGFALYVGTDCSTAGSTNCLGVGFYEMWLFVGNVSVDGLLNILYTAIMDPLTIGILITGGVAAFLSGNRNFTLPLIVLAALANILFMPFTFISSAPIPVEFIWLIKGFFGILMLLAVLSFTIGRSF